MSFSNYHSAIEFVNSKSKFNFEESYNLLSYANKLFYKNEDEGRDIIIRLLDKEIRKMLFLKIVKFYLMI